MTEHRIMDDLRRSETMLSQLQAAIIERDEYDTASDVLNTDDRLDQIIYILSRIRYDVAWRANHGILHRETNDSTANPEDINAAR